jgi:type II secretory pathway pseudopilin PulG
MIRLTSRGDTIIEVLLSIAIVSAALGGAYVSSNRSLANARQSQERSEALVVGQQQLEALKVLTSDSSSGVYTPPNNFCIIISPTPHKQLLPSPNCAFGTGQRYQAAIQYVRVIGPPEERNFTISITWERFGGGNDAIQLNYRVYP